MKLPTAPEAAAQAIRNPIIAGELKPGVRLPEQKWGARLGIGQPTLAGSFKRVAVPRDYRAILEDRLPLEAMAFKRAAVRLTPDIEQELRNLVLSMTRTCEDLDVAAFHSHEVDFHRRIWDLADNKYLKLSLEGLCFRLFVFAVLGRDENWFRASVRQTRKCWGPCVPGIRNGRSRGSSMRRFEETMCLRSVTPR